MVYASGATERQIGSRRRKRRRLTSAAAVGAVVGALALAACSPTGDQTGTPSGSTSSTAEPADLSGDITYMFWNRTQQPAIEQEISEFNKQYPDVTVTLDLTPWDTYWTKLQTLAQSGTLPDVFWLNNDNFELYASNGLLAKAPDTIDYSAFTQSVVESYAYDGVQYGIPSFQAGLGVWYNKAVLEKAGVAVPSPDWTWEDFQRDAKAVSDALKSEGIYGVTDDLSDGNATYYPTILQAGGYVISPDGKQSGFDTEAGIAGLSFWRDLIANGSSPTLQQLADTSDFDWFSSGKSAFFWGISSYADRLADSDVAADVDVLPLPTGKVAANIVLGNSNVLSANSKNPEAAAAFVEFLAGEPAQQLIATATWPARSGSPQVLWEAKYRYDMQVFVDAQKISKSPFPSLPTTAEWQQAEQALMPKLMSGEEPVDTVAKEIATHVNAILAK